MIAEFGITPNMVSACRAALLRVEAGRVWHDTWDGAVSTGLCLLYWTASPHHFKPREFAVALALVVAVGERHHETRHERLLRELADDGGKAGDAGEP